MTRLLFAALAALAVLAGLSVGLLRSGEKWCFANPDSINGPFVAFWHLKFLSLDLAYTTSITLREPGWRCTTLALSSAKSVEQSLLSDWLKPLPLVSPVSGAAHPAAPGLMDAAKGLIVQIFNVTSLVPSQASQHSDALRPYVTYEVVGQKAHFTSTGHVVRRNEPAKKIFDWNAEWCDFAAPLRTPLQDINRMVVRVDRDFCRWAENGGGLHVVVFDAAVPPAGASEEQIGLLGEVRVPLSQLLTSRLARVQGNYPLHRPGLQPPAGHIEMAIGWQDDPTSVVAGPSVLEADRGPLTEEQFQVLWQRVIRRLHVLKLAPVDCTVVAGIRRRWESELRHKQEPSRSSDSSWKKFRGNGVKSKVNTIVSALRDGGLDSEVPETARWMLADGASAAFATVANRHKFQIEMCNLILETLQDIASRLQNKVDEAKKDASALATEQESKKAELTAAGEILTEASAEAKKVLSDLEQAWASLESEGVSVKRRRDQQVKEQTKFTPLGAEDVATSRVPPVVLALPPAGQAAEGVRGPKEMMTQAKARLEDMKQQLEAAEEVACEKEVNVAKMQSSLEAFETSAQEKAKAIEAAEANVTVFAEVLAIYHDLHGDAAEDAENAAVKAEALTAPAVLV
eukprot:g1874.t1